MCEKQQFLFVRHGETVGNLDQIAHGQTESPLNDRGIRQAPLLSAPVLVTGDAGLGDLAQLGERAGHTGPLVIDDQLGGLAVGRGRERGGGAGGKNEGERAKCMLHRIGSL